MPALRMAANLVARRIAPAVARAQLDPLPSVEPRRTRHAGDRAPGGEGPARPARHASLSRPAHDEEPHSRDD